MAKYDSFDAFIKAYVGTAKDYDGCAGCQCVDLVKFYMDDVLDIKAGNYGNAHDYYDHFYNYKDLTDNFTRIANTPAFVPQKGDVMVWSSSLSPAGWGHIAICDGVGDTNYFYSYDCNWTGQHDPCVRIKHNYNSVLGVLRPKKDVSGVSNKPAENNVVEKNNNVKRVIDISEYQSSVDYAKLAKEVDGAIIRVGYRGWGSAGTLCKDSLFSTHLNGVKANKIPYGFYFFSQAKNEQEGKAEAEYVHSLIKGSAPSYPIFIDVEDSGAPNKSGRADGISKQDRTNAMCGFCKRITELGYVGGVYASTSWFDYKFTTSSISKYSIWVADYGINDGKPHTKPSIVSMDGWQFTSVCKIEAIKGNVDMSHFYNNYNCKYTEPAPAPAPAPAPVVTVSYKTYYVTCEDGLNYRATPNGTKKGQFAYRAAVKVVVGSEKTVSGLVWVKVENGCYVVKKYLSTTKPASAPFEAGKTYTLTTDLNVRKGAGTSYGKKLRSAVPTAEKSKTYNQTYAVYKKGSKVKVTAVTKKSDKEYWGKTSAGWICLRQGGTNYVK